MDDDGMKEMLTRIRGGARCPRCRTWDDLRAVVGGLHICATCAGADNIEKWVEEYASEALALHTAAERKRERAKLRKEGRKKDCQIPFRTTQAIRQKLDRAAELKQTTVNRLLNVFVEAGLDRLLGVPEGSKD
jgi:hypothetical protein